MNEPLFTIVIPTYNRAGFISATINSILQQTFTNFELIVVDDGSTDNTEAVVREITDARIRYFKKANGERAAARNFGVGKARGRFINFVDSDDLLYPKHLEEANDLVLKNPSVRIFHLGYDVRTQRGTLLRDSRAVHDPNKQLLTGNILACAGVFVDREAALEDQFNEDRTLSAIEDWELWLRFAAKYKIIHNPVITSTVVQHEERSVMSVDINKIKAKVDLFIDMISNNRILGRAFGSNVNKIVASALTYKALHVAIAKGNRSEIVSFTFRGIRKNPGELFSRRFLVILKFLIIR